MLRLFLVSMTAAFLCACSGDAVPCLLQTFELPGGKHFEIGYESGRISTVRYTKGDTSGLAAYTYDSNGRLSAVRQETGERIKEIIFVYDEKDRLMEISEPDGSVPIKFEYDDRGRIVVMDGYRNGKSFWLTEYSYGESDCPTGSLLNSSGYKTESAFKYLKDKKNPFVGLAYLHNPLGGIYGRPVGQCADLIDEVARSITRPGEERGSKASQKAVYEFNDRGYPTSISSDTQKVEPRKLTYSCE